ncbi:MAG: ABC transporter ATP-binding protein [Solirubrobacterales bacterium]
MSAISLNKLSKRFPDGTEAVKEMDLEVEDGEFLILVGPSGCGKSTALRMIAGLEDISDGELKIGGDVVNGKAPKDRDIAMIFQNYALYPHMTVRENMAFPLKMADTDDETTKKKVEEAAEILELEEHLDRRPANLSGGQRQRVAMGRAIVRDPQAFLMDEPLSNLDAKLRVQMRTEVSRIQKDLGTTTVYVTHDQTEAMTLGDRVAVMRKGVLQQVGSPQELYDEPRNLFVAGFIGSPSMNFMPVEVNDGVAKLPMAEAELPAETRKALEQSSSERLMAGIRPEHFEDVNHAPEKPGPTFKVTVDILESMGSELYAYFTTEGSSERSEQLEELAADTGGDLGTGSGDEIQIVARLDAASDAARGNELELWMDASRLQFFDLDSGERIAGAGSKQKDGAGKPGGSGSDEGGQRSTNGGESSSGERGEGSSGERSSEG